MTRESGEWRDQSNDQMFQINGTGDQVEPKQNFSHKLVQHFSKNN